MADRNIFFDVYAQLVSVHPRHHHIADNDIRNVTFDKLESLHPISGNDYPFERFFQCLFRKSVISGLSSTTRMVYGVVSKVSLSVACFQIITKHQFVQIRFRLADNLF